MCNRFHRALGLAAAVFLLLLSPAASWAHPDASGETAETLEEVRVEGRRVNLVGETRSASEGVIGQSELLNRPLLRAGDVLESIPNLIMTQHSGSGKSNQMFLRGFNLDHGTDFATWVDGMPVNMRSHGHGQGYTDINFIIPELVRVIDYRKGPGFAELGDFSSAGGAFISHYEELPGGTLKLGVGENDYLRALVADSAKLGSGHVLAAVEAKRYDGPWQDIEEDLERLNGMLRWSRKSGRSSSGASLMFYDATWNSADQIPERAVRQGLIGPLGSLDDTVGGETRRASLSAYHRWSGDRSDHAVSFYAIDYRMRLWSNFTYFLENPEDGDGFEQFDDRRIYGGEWTSDWVSTVGGSHLHHRLGLQFRHDAIDGVGLFHARDRERIGTVRFDEVDETSLGLFYELEWYLGEQWRAVLGLRADRYRFDVEAIREVNSGDESDHIVSPKASLAYRINPAMELYFSAGFGFHSNDARGVTIQLDPVTGEAAEAVDPLVRSRGLEAGWRTSTETGWNLTVALWYLELDSELLYVGDAGNTEASRPSRRYGIEFNNFWKLNDIWTLEADFAWNDAEFTEWAPEGQSVPGAIETVVTAAVTAEWPSGWFSQLRYRYFGGAPLVEDGSVESGDSNMINASVGWQGEHWRVQLDVLNLLDSDDHDIDYYYASRLPGEPAGGVEDVHFHIFEPRQLRLAVSYSF